MTVSNHDLIQSLLDNPAHAWSMGTFGAIGEFMRDADETVTRSDDGRTLEIITPRAGLRVTALDDLKPIAFDTLGSDGETWGQSMLFCLPVSAEQLKSGGVVRGLGADTDALRDSDREAMLFDMGVGLGHVRMCARTSHPDLIRAFEALEGKPLIGPDSGEATRLVLATSPNRVMLSPAGRLEVYTPIPGPNGESPNGPHTHLLPKLIASKRTHAANAPVPEGWQPVLNAHPRTPWRDAMGRRTPFNTELDETFTQLLARYGLPEDLAIRADVEKAVKTGLDPASYAWPETRRGRTAARITLRRLAQKNSAPVDRWRALYDAVAMDEAEDDAALHG